MKLKPATKAEFLATMVAVTFFAGMVTPAFSGEKSVRRSHHVRVERRDQGRHNPRPRHYYSHRHGRYVTAGVGGSVFFPIPFGKVLVSLPGVYRTIHVGPHSYYYCDGVYYSRHDHGYVVVRPPRIRYIPYRARRLVIGGEVYFLHNDLYYCYRDGFYEVCEPPVVVEKKSAATTTIMVENSNGSRTPVELEPLGGNQWKGPRGEIYDGLPTDEQLKEGYGF